MHEVHTLTLTVSIVRDVQDNKDFFTVADMYENIRELICDGLTDDKTVVSCDYENGFVNVI